MHQSPQKKLAKRRDKYVDFELTEADADRRLYRDSQPRARRFALREDAREGGAGAYGREPRQDKSHAR